MKQGKNLAVSVTGYKTSNVKPTLCLNNMKHVNYKKKTY